MSVRCRGVLLPSGAAEIKPENLNRTMPAEGRMPACSISLTHSRKVHNMKERT